jgi:cytochrome c553
MATVARWRIGKFLFWIVVAALGLPGAAALVAWSGLISIAASRGHWAVVDWFLAFGMRNSVELRAMVITPPPLDSPDLIRLGAAHFHGGCAFCHGAPSIALSPIGQQMLPSPPDLTAATRSWKDRELFWIVRHGIKYTGMPGWVALEREDEIWAVVAFLRQLPKLDADAYRELALGSARVTEWSGERLATVEASPHNTGACARCHGAGGEGPSSALVPVLHGQRAEFLLAALEAYAKGNRRSGIMQPLAADLDPQDMRPLADYYAKLPPPKPRRTALADIASDRGRMLATEGDPASGIPACNGCHRHDSLAIYPRLAGQNAAYMMGQLRLWQAGHRTGSAGGALMAPIARRLSEADVQAVSAYFAGLAADTDSAVSR